MRNQGNNGKKKDMHPTELKTNNSRSFHSLAPILVQGYSGFVFSFVNC